MLTIEVSQIYIYKPKKIKVVFPLSLPTLICCADPKVFIAIFRQTVKV